MMKKGKEWLLERQSSNYISFFISISAISLRLAVENLTNAGGSDSSQPYT